MKTQVDLSTLSDGKIYDLFDLAPTDTQGCSGCSECCHGIGETAQLNPYDVFTIGKALNKGFFDLVGEHFDIRAFNRLKMPYLKMIGPNERCNFLDASGRCGIHSTRPDVCRLFPLGRAYSQDEVAFFFQPDACVKPNLLPIAVADWISIDRYEENREFLLQWRQVLKAFDFKLRFVYDEAEKEMLIQVFFEAFFDDLLKSNEDFYSAFSRTLPNIKKKLGIL